MTSALDVALSLAQGPNHYKVFPCAADKRPLTKNGFIDASNDPEKIYLMPWARAGLVGIACAPSGVLAVDIDNKDGRNGSQSWQNLLSAYGAAVDAGPMQSTPSGGYHLVFAHPPVDVSQSHDTLADGIDIRSSGYICTGAGYSWLEGRGPHCELLDAPAFLLMLLAPKPEPVTTAAARPSHYTTNTDKWLNDALSMARIGNRNQTGFWLACQLRDDGITQSEACALSYPEGVPQKNGNKYTRRDWTKTVQSAYSKTPREPARSLSSPPTPGNPSPAAPGKPLGEGGGPPEPEAPPNFSPETPTEPKPARASWSVADLLAADFPEPRWAVPDLFPEGLTLFGGRPKSGKSWTMLDAAHAVAVGGVFLGKRVTRGAVLFLALEDGARRLQNRLRTQRITAEADIEFITGNQFMRDWKPLQAGGLDLLRVAIETKEYRLIVIDTLTRALPGIDMTKDAAQVGRVLGDLQAMAIHKGIAIVCLDHTRKPNGYESDPIDDIMGTTNKSGVADAVYGLYREQGKPGAVLKGRGRDFEDVDLTLKWDPMTCTWQNEGNTGELRITRGREEILDGLRANGKSTATALARLIGKDRANLSRTMAEMYSAGVIQREVIGKEFYYYTGEE